MSRRRFIHSNNPGFSCRERVLVLPFGRESYLPAIAERYGGRRLELDETTDRIVFQLDGTSRPTTLVYTGMGSPAVANGLEMIAANGGRHLALFGACGGARSDVSVGDLVLAEEAVRGEGTSSYYGAASDTARCDSRTVEALAAAATETGHRRLHRGRVYTTDAGYRQGAEVYGGRHGDIVAVECECSAAAVVATELGLTLGALFFVTDNVTATKDEDRAYRGLTHPAVKAAFTAGLTATVKALASL